MNDVADNTGDDDDIDDLRARNAALQIRLTEAEATTRDRVIQAELKAEAVRAGMIDLDGLKLITPALVPGGANGDTPDAQGVIAQLCLEKPWLFRTPSSSSVSQPPQSAPRKPRLATEMSLDEWRTARAELLRRR